MVMIEEIAHKTRLLDERGTKIKSIRESRNLLRARIDGLTVDLSDKAKFIGEDEAKFNEKQADKLTLPMFEGEEGVWSASLTDKGL